LNNNFFRLHFEVPVQICALSYDSTFKIGQVTTAFITDRSFHYTIAGVYETEGDQAGSLKTFTLDQATNLKQFKGIKLEHVSVPKIYSEAKVVKGEDPNETEPTMKLRCTSVYGLVHVEFVCEMEHDLEISLFVTSSLSTAEKPMRATSGFTSTAITLQEYEAADGLFGSNLGTTSENVVNGKGCRENGIPIKSAFFNVSGIPSQVPSDPTSEWSDLGLAPNNDTITLNLPGPDPTVINPDPTAKIGDRFAAGGFHFVLLWDSLIRKPPSNKPQ